MIALKEVREYNESICKEFMKNNKAGDKMSKKCYVLRNKNNIVLPFTFEKNEFQETIFEQTEEEKAVLPYSFTSIQSFIERRREPKSRMHIAKLLQETGCDDFEKFIDVTMGLSLNDTFWMKQALIC